MAESDEELTTTQAEQLHQTLFELITDACLLTTRCGVIQEANEAACKLLGASQNRLVGERLEHYLTESEHSALFAQLSQLELANGFQAIDHAVATAWSIA